MSADRVTLTESVEGEVRARLERDISDNTSEKLAVEDVFDFEAVLADVADLLANRWSRVGFDGLEVGTIDDDEWIELTAASPNVTRPWVFCNDGCTPAALGGWEPCGVHRDVYEGMHGVSFEDLRAEAAESRLYAAGYDF